MKKFNLEQALAGAKVVTRDGEKVTQLHLFDAPDGEFPLHCVVDGQIRTYTKSGSYFEYADHAQDLLMAPVKHTAWINIYAVGSVAMYDSKAHADKAAGRDRIACFKKEYTEGEGL